MARSKKTRSTEETVVTPVPTGKISKFTLALSDEDRAQIAKIREGLEFKPPISALVTSWIRKGIRDTADEHKIAID